MHLERALTTTQMQQQILAATEMDQLRTVREQMSVIAKRWHLRGLPESEILHAVNLWHEQVIRQVIQLTLQQMEAQGLGAPPVPFCWLLLGSGGRQEMTLAPDQDHALLYEDDGTSADSVRSYFQALAERVTMRLSNVGYPYCAGNVMATNPRWNLSNSEWERQIETYVQLPNWDHVRFLMMLSDLRPVYGERTLAERLRERLGERLRSFAYLHWQVADHLRERAVGLDWREAFRVDSYGEQAGQVNVKEGGYMQLISAVRLHALAWDVRATSTRERIVGLQEQKAWTDTWAKEVQAALEVFCRHRLWSNYVHPRSLSAEQTTALKDAMKTTKQLQKMSAKQFRKPK